MIGDAFEGNWYRCSEAERKLIESCGPDETCVLFGERGVVKLPSDTWGHLFGSAINTATKAACDDAGIECRMAPDGDGGIRMEFSENVTILYSEGGKLYDWDMAKSTVTVRVRGPDGRVGAGVVCLTPPSLN